MQAPGNRCRTCVNPRNAYFYAVPESSLAHHIMMIGCHKLSDKLSASSWCSSATEVFFEHVLDPQLSSAHLRLLKGSYVAAGLAVAAERGAHIFRSTRVLLIHRVLALIIEVKRSR